MAPKRRMETKDTRHSKTFDPKNEDEMKAEELLTDPEQSKQQKQKRKENKVLGPVELFFNSITKAGGEMVSTSRAYFKGEVAYDIMEGPANWVRPWLRGVARRAALARAEGRRPS